MIGELLCPDCGGVVGATETTEAGAPCRCFISDRSRSSETVMDHPPVSDAPVAIAKVCRICGKDVTGEKRVKDNAGYYCMPCAREQDKNDHQGRVRCRVCGHLTKEENLTPYEGTKMCPRCQRERVELQKQQIKRMGFKSARTRAELSQIYGMVAVLVVLLLIMLYGVLKMFHHH